MVYVFTAPGPDNRVYRYRISTGERSAISPDAAGSPSIRGGAVAWATNPYFDRDPGLSWAVQTYSLRTGTIATVARGLDASTTRYATLAAGHVAYLVNDDQGRPQVLYLVTQP